MNNIPLNNEDLALLHLLRNEKLALKAIRVIHEGAVLFPERYAPYLSCLWNTFMHCMLEQKKLTGKFTVDRKDYVAAALEALEKLDTIKEYKAAALRILELYEHEEVLDPAKGKQYLAKLVEGALQRQISSAVVRSSAFEQLKSLIAKGSKLIEDVNTDEKDKTLQLYSFPLANIESLMKRTVRIPLGIPFLDKATGGGVSTKEMAIIGGVTGGGKSHLTVQLVASQLTLRQYVGWATYEQPLDKDLSERLVANLTDFNLSDIRNKEFTELPESVQELYRAAVQGVEDYIVAMDFTTEDLLDPNDPMDDGGAYSIGKRLRAYREKTGHSIKILVLDWFGEMISKLAGKRGVDLSSCYRFFARDELRILREVAEKEDCFIFVFHQLSKKVIDAPATNVPIKTDFQDISTISNNAEYCFLLGKLDDENRAWFNADKTRKVPRSLQIIRLDGEHARFIKEEGYQPDKRSGQFVQTISNIEDLAGKASIKQDLDTSYTPILEEKP